ncbi:hypothetical protein TREES_T100020264 [Tupaia chinensis]|uniref:Uncharacterized protein n=1 Tax=Tupaia chinensis TaxID=246437 RepID=L9L8F8_TUPCH|nr:hypothetical protein TREES_T100020264 [Tupaia chinensis]
MATVAVASVEATSLTHSQPTTLGCSSTPHTHPPHKGRVDVGAKQSLLAAPNVCTSKLSSTLPSRSFQESWGDQGGPQVVGEVSGSVTQHTPAQRLGDALCSSSVSRTMPLQPSVSIPNSNSSSSTCTSRPAETLHAISGDWLLTTTPLAAACVRA